MTSWAELQDARESHVGPLIHQLLGCEWGHGRIGDRRIHADSPCPERAVQIIVVHDGARELSFKFCERHRDLVLAETTPHG